MEKKMEERVSAPQSASENEYYELQSVIAETLFEAKDKVLEAVQLARKAKEIEPEEIDLDESMECIDEIKYDIEILLNVL